MVIIPLKRKCILSPTQKLITDNTSQISNRFEDLFVRQIVPKHKQKKFHVDTSKWHTGLKLYRNGA